MSSFWNWFDKEDGGFCCQAEKEEKVKVGDGKRPLASEAGEVRKRRQSSLRLSDRTESYVCVVCSFVVCFCPACPARRPSPRQPRTNARAAQYVDRPREAERSASAQYCRTSAKKTRKSWKIGVKSEKISAIREGFRLRT